MNKFKRNFLPAILLLFAITGVDAQSVDRFKVMNWNLRLDVAVDGPNQWKYRKDGVCRLIKEESPDILGVQEPFHNQVTDVKKGVKGYNYVGVARDDGKKSGEYSAVFYKKSRFKAVGSGTFWLSETPGKPGSRGWDADHNRVATWVILKEKQSGKEIFVINTHLDNAGVKARTEGAALIMQKTGELYGGRPVILTGDFNSPDTDQPYRIITWPENEVVLTDTRVKAGDAASGPSFTYTGFKGSNDEPEYIDFIFTSHEFRVISHLIFDCRKGDLWLSDHLPLITVIELMK